MDLGPPGLRARTKHEDSRKARKRAGFLPSTKAARVKEWEDLKELEGSVRATQRVDPQFLALKKEVDRARSVSRAAMEDGLLLDALHIAGRRRWAIDPRYSNVSFSTTEEDILYFLNYLPPEVEWAFWMMDLRKANQLSAEQQTASEFLHARAERDARSFAAATRSAREQQSREKPRFRTTLRTGLSWGWEHDLDPKGRLIEVFVPHGYSLALWGRPRHNPASPKHHYKRGQRDWTLSEKLAGRSLAEHIEEAAREVGYTASEFVAKFAKGHQSTSELKRRGALAEVVFDLLRSGATQRLIAEATGLSQDQLSRLNAYAKERRPPNAYKA